MPTVVGLTALLCQPRKLIIVWSQLVQKSLDWTSLKETAILFHKFRTLQELVAGRWPPRGLLPVQWISASAQVGNDRMDISDAFLLFGQLFVIHRHLAHPFAPHVFVIFLGSVPHWQRLGPKWPTIANTTRRLLGSLYQPASFANTRPAGYNEVEVALMYQVTRPCQQILSPHGWSSLIDDHLPSVQLYNWTSAIRFYNRPNFTIPLVL